MKESWEFKYTSTFYFVGYVLIICSKIEWSIEHPTTSMMNSNVFNEAIHIGSTYSYKLSITNSISLWWIFIMAEYESSSTTY